MSPFLILGIGIAVVLGSILILRLNAFLALLVAALIVSLLSPGPWGSKIQRVAEAFGTSAGNIGIVIALAAIIGECLMLSGAADRVVQAFLQVLGEKRAPWALMGSGYVLAIPVFFDTVFYLLVPLARSLYRRTEKNYLLFLLAIAGGGAITHTLVPPTPGPLVIAANLGVDVGLMIMIGALVAAPSAMIGLAFSGWLDRRWPAPFREDRIVGNEDDNPAVPVSTPPLFLSLLPVLLPVALIATNTALTTLANREHPALLSVDDLRDWSFLRLQGRSPEQQYRTIGIRSRLPADVQYTLSSSEEPTAEQKSAAIEALNELLQDRRTPLFAADRFADLSPPRWVLESELRQPEVEDEERAQLERLLKLDGWLTTGPASLPPLERERFQRTLLEASYPDAITPHVWETPLRRAAELSSLFGNANSALLLSAITAILLYVRMRRPSLRQLGETVEAALMSAGVIILITAAGGAFGAMLKLSQIDLAVREMFSRADAGPGLSMLLLGYGIAATLKVAQGSSTVAMITASGMLAAIAGGTTLPFHSVYLATAIGAGSLMGSWMNDSGFWVFTKMGRLTEREGLTSWTLLLMVLSLTALATTVALSWALPLI